MIIVLCNKMIINNGDNSLVKFSQFRFPHYVFIHFSFFLKRDIDRI